MSNNISITSYGNYETYANEKDMLEALCTGDKSKMISSESTSTDPVILAGESIVREQLKNRSILFGQYRRAELLGISVEELKELEKNMWKHNVK